MHKALNITSRHLAPGMRAVMSSEHADLTVLVAGWLDIASKDTVRPFNDTSIVGA